MRDDDDALAGIDLDAWAPPPPPAADALADAVVARMREPARAAAAEPAGRGGAARRRRWPIAVGAVVLAAAGVLAIVRGGTARPPADGNGEVFAARASHLALGPSAAELDPGAEVRWRREQRRIAAVQPRGGVLWRVGGDDTLAIDAGAAVASVEASGASLRVEVQMNLSDARAIGASAAAAAVVALITVTVYEGNVKVTSAGQTVQAEPGTTVEVRPRQGSGDAIAVGAAPPSLDQMKQEVRALKERLDAAERTLAAQQTPPAPPAPPPAPADTLDRAAIEKGLQPVRSAIAACDDGSYRGTIAAMATVAPDGDVNGVVLQPARTAIHGCVELALRAARFDATRRGGVLRESFRFTAAPRPAPSRSCDADALADQGKEHYAAGSLAAALASFEQAYACRPDLSFTEKAFVAACNIPLVEKAALFYRRMTPQSRARALMICVRNGITEEMLAQAPALPGKLQVSSAPPAQVIVDGKQVGETPLTLELPPGRHAVKLQTSSASAVYTVQIKSGETVTLDKTLGAP